MMNISFAELILLGAIALLVALIVRPSFRERFVGAFRGVRPWHLLVLALAWAIVTVGWHGPAFLLAMAAVVALFGYYWFREFRFLMRLRDEDFPGRFDKPIWAMLLILLPPVGVPTFWSYRMAHWPEAKRVSAEAAHDLT